MPFSQILWAIGFTRVRTPYVSDADTAHLTEDPAAYLDVYPGPIDWKPAFMDDDADTLMTEAA